MSSSTTLKVIAYALAMCIGGLVVWNIAWYIELKKFKRRRFETEQAWMQRVYDDLRSGKLDFMGEETKEKLATIMRPLRSDGLLN